jgi:RNA 3'-terminal phosphate cyclase (ATP)
MATGQPFVMRNIRAGRVKPGLMRQHLVCVTAAASICDGRYAGAQLGSSTVEFIPGRVKPSSYRIPIGTAGSTTMVLQAVLPALLREKDSCSLAVEGGTHNTQAPSYEFFAESLVPLLNRMGANVKCTMEQRGFYPAGGGRIRVEVSGNAAPEPLELHDRGELVNIRASAETCKLKFAIAERERETVMRLMQLNADQTRAGSHADSVSPGNIVCVRVEHEHLTEVFVALGQLGKTAEAVAGEAADAAKAYLNSGVAVGEHLADQLMVPMALMAGGSFVTGPLSPHSTTNIRTIERFGIKVETTTTSHGTMVRVPSMSAGQSGKSA